MEPAHKKNQCLLIAASVHAGRARLYRLESDTVTVTAVFPRIAVTVVMEK